MKTNETPYLENTTAIHFDKKKGDAKPAFQWNDNRERSTIQRKLQHWANNSSMQSRLGVAQRLINNSKETKGNRPHLITQNNLNSSNSIIQRGRNHFSKSDVSRGAQHTSSVLKMGKVIIRKFSSGDGAHAEDKAIIVIKKKLNQLPRGSGETKRFSLGLTKSPCTDPFTVGRTNYVGTSEKKGAAGCAQKLMALQGTEINGYKIHLSLYLLRTYTPQVRGGKKSSIEILKKIRRKGITTRGLGKSNIKKFAENDELSDGEDARKWRVKKHVEMNVDETNSSDESGSDD